MLPSLSTHLLGTWRQLGGGSGAAAAAATKLPPLAAVVALKTLAATAMAGAQTTIHNQLNVDEQ